MSRRNPRQVREFPFLFGGTFIEAKQGTITKYRLCRFPFLFGGTFIEAMRDLTEHGYEYAFPFLFGGTFIEAPSVSRSLTASANFPSFSEGLSLRLKEAAAEPTDAPISLPFRRDFH